MTTHVYASGLCYLSVCSDGTTEEIERIANETTPTGIESQWKISANPTFIAPAGAPNPSPCDKDRPGYLHYLLEC